MNTRKSFLAVLFGQTPALPPPYLIILVVLLAGGLPGCTRTTASPVPLPPTRISPTFQSGNLPDTPFPATKPNQEGTATPEAFRTLIPVTRIVIAKPTLITQTSPGVQTIPNEAMITATVQSQQIRSASSLGIEPEQQLSVLEIKLDGAQGIQGRSNLLADKIGTVLQALSKEGTDVDLNNKVISAHCSYRGDEHGGRFWLTDIQIVSR